MDQPDRKSSRMRRLARHEAELWEQVVRHVTPMRPRKKEPGQVELGRDPEKTKIVPATHAEVPAPRKPAVQLKPLVRVEATIYRRLSRGQREPESRLDLHGMRQAEAHAALRAYLHRAHGNGQRIVLVVTGKGSRGAEGLGFEERGVLRRSLPHWLAAPDLRSIVLGFEEASRRHGGEGAFYVQLRGFNARKPGHAQ